MLKANAVKTGARDSINLGGRKVDYRLTRSSAARKLRVRVGLAGIEVVQPEAREAEEVEAFLRSHGVWILGQLERVERFRSVQKPQCGSVGEMLYRGVPTRVQVEDMARRQGANRVVFDRHGDSPHSDNAGGHVLSWARPPANTRPTVPRRGKRLRACSQSSVGLRRVLALYVSHAFDDLTVTHPH